MNGILESLEIALWRHNVKRWLFGLQSLGGNILECLDDPDTSSLYLKLNSVILIVRGPFVFC